MNIFFNTKLQFVLVFFVICILFPNHSQAALVTADDVEKEFAEITKQLKERLTPLAEANPSVITECDKEATVSLSEEQVVIPHSYYTINPEKAIPACREAVKQYPDSARLHYNLAMSLKRLQTYGAVTDAISHFEKAAELGSIKSIAWLGAIYRIGFGINKDYDKASEYLSEAVKLGSDFAEVQQVKLYYQYGYCPKDSVSNNLFSALLQCRPNLKRYVEELEKLDAKGNNEASFWLANAYEDGITGKADKKNSSLLV